MPRAERAPRREVAVVRPARPPRRHRCHVQRARHAASTAGRRRPARTGPTMPPRTTRAGAVRVQICCGAWRESTSTRTPRRSVSDERGGLELVGRRWPRGGELRPARRGRAGPAGRSASVPCARRETSRDSAAPESTSGSRASLFSRSRVSAPASSALPQLPVEEQRVPAGRGRQHEALHGALRQAAAGRVHEGLRARQRDGQLGLRQARPRRGHEHGLVQHLGHAREHAHRAAGQLPEPLLQVAEVARVDGRLGRGRGHVQREQPAPQPGRPRVGQPQLGGLAPAQAREGLRHRLPDIHSRSIHRDW